MTWQGLGTMPPVSKGPVSKMSRVAKLKDWSVCAQTLGNLIIAVRSIT